VGFVKHRKKTKLKKALELKVWPGSYPSWNLDRKTLESGKNKSF
jgi:hypothetical protein